MSLSRKYGRTFHYPFSPGTASDDRINHGYWEDVSAIEKIVHTEKLDGENTCLNQYGVFARSHVAPTVHPWANYLKERWHLIKNDLGDLEIFGENLYAIQIAKEMMKIHLRKQQSFVFNATNIIQQLRRQWIDLFTTYGAKVKIIYLEVSYAQLMQQNSNREYVVPTKVMEKMIGKLEIPSLVEAQAVKYLTS